MELLSLALYLLLTLVFLQAALVSLAKTKKTTNNKLPPGPARLPVIGNLHKLGNKPHQSLAELAKIHGPIMSLKLGRIISIVISSSTIAKEVLQKQDLAFSTRSVPNAAHAHAHNQYSSAWLPVGERWRSLRKIMNSHILSSSRLEASVKLRYCKVQDLVDYVAESCQDGVTVDIGRAAFTTSLNFLSNIVFSIDLADLGQDSSNDFKDVILDLMKEVGSPNLVDYFPVLAKFDPQGIRGRMTKYYGRLFQIFGQLIDERVKLRKLHKSNAENDVLDVLLNISEDIDRIHMEHLLLDIFAAGTDTTSSTVEWAMTELLQNPETLKKAKAELERTIGKGKIVEESDLDNLPYLRAIVKETMRKHPSAPFLIPRKVTTDVELCGYTIPTGAQVLVNAWTIGRDPSTWPSPNSFRPERFLGSEIDLRGRDFELIPFGAGRRICPGLPLAIRMVPLMLGSLINSFDWKLEDGILPSALDMEERFGLTLQKAQPLRAIPFHVS